MQNSFTISRTGKMAYNGAIFEVKKGNLGPHLLGKAEITLKLKQTRTILLTLAALLAAVVVCFAADVKMGTWKLS